MSPRRFVLPLLLLALTPSAQAQSARPAKTLEECVELALANHPTLGSAAAAVDGASARVHQTQAGYLPQVEGFFSADRRNTTASARIGTPGLSGAQAITFSYYSSSVTLSQVLFDFGKNLFEIRASRAQRESLEADEATQRDLVVFDVKQSYFDLLAAQRLLGVADETVRSVAKQAEQARGRYEVGLAAKIDVTRSQVQLATAQLDRVTARNNVAVAEETLRNALGLRAPLDFEPVDVLDVRPLVASESESVAVAYEHRPELRSLRARQRATEESITSLRLDHLPVVTGNATYQWNGSDYPLDPSWNVGAALRLSLTNGGLTMAQVAEARANLRALRFDEETLRQDIALEVRQAVLALGEAAERITVSERAVQQARENLELAEGRYRTGVGNVIELTDAQAARASSEADLVRALYEHQIAVATLERATGRPVARP